MKKHLTVILFVHLSLIAIGQSSYQQYRQSQINDRLANFANGIQIGMSASDIEWFVANKTANRIGYDNKGNSKGNNVAYDVKYNNGEISDVIQCYNQQYLIDFNVTVSYCKHYIMGSGVLAYILTQYESLSTSKLHEIYNKLYYKVGDYYYERDFEYRSKIYIGSNGLASVEWDKTPTVSLSEDEKAQIEQMRYTKKQEAIDRENKEQFVNAIRGKTYDLKEYNSSLYDIALNGWVDGTFQFLVKNKENPNYFLYAYQGNTRVRNVYSVHRYYEKPNTFSFYPNIEKNLTYEQKSNSRIEIKLISGEDPRGGRLVAGDGSSLPTITIQGYEVLTSATFIITVDLKKGPIDVKVSKKGDWKVLSSDPIEPEVLQKIKDKNKEIPNGKHHILYRIGNVNGKEFIDTDVLEY